MPKQKRYIKDEINPNALIRFGAEYVAELELSQTLIRLLEQSIKI